VPAEPAATYGVRVICATKVHIEAILFGSYSEVERTKDIVSTLRRTFCPSARSAAIPKASTQTSTPFSFFSPQRQSCFSTFSFLLRCPVGSWGGTPDTQKQEKRFAGWFFVCGMYPNKVTGTLPHKVGSEFRGTTNPSCSIRFLDRSMLDRSRSALPLTSRGPTLRGSAATHTAPVNRGLPSPRHSSPSLDVSWVLSSWAVLVGVVSYFT
jgi:hypothetical protein